MADNNERMPLWYWVSVYPCLFIVAVFDLLFVPDDAEDDDDELEDW